MTPQLTVIEGPDKGRSFPLEAGKPLQVGRSKETPTKLADATVSRLHFQIEWDGTTFTLTNVSSAGTRVNGLSVTEQELHPGDIIRIGSTTAIRLDAQPEMSTLAPPRPQPAAPVTQLGDLVGKTLSHFALSSVIGKGDTGWVFKAWDTKEDRVIALKVLQPEFAANDDDMQRFIRAMKTVLQLRHPNLVALQGAGKTGVFCWVAMEYIEGENMTQVIQRIGVANMLDWRYGYRVAVHVARGLEYAHSQSILHRNVTPRNILMRLADKQIFLGDLMLAKALEGSMAKQITRPGEMVGDISYMSPERTRNEADVDARSDLYGLGATVYALITGKPPFAGGSLPEMVKKIRDGEPEKPSKYQMSIPQMFQGAILKLLAKRPDERFQSATELLTDLERIGKFSGATA
jgi:serine/threonine protein kinase